MSRDESAESVDRAAKLEVVNRAFVDGDNRKGLTLLRELSQALPADAEIAYRTAVVEEQIGDGAVALADYLRCIAAAPNNPLAYLYAGHCFHILGDTERAAACFSLGADCNAALLNWWNEPGRDEETRKRSVVANQVLRTYLSDLHRHSCGEDPTVTRIRDAIWTRTHDRSYQFHNARQIPQLFYVPELTAVPYFDAECEWKQTLENKAAEIEEEVLERLPLALAAARPYLQDGMELDAGLAKLVGSSDWSAIDLYRDGRMQDGAEDWFPLTLDVLRDLPLYGLDETPYEVFLSLLRPGQHITPHYGLSNHALTVHLPIRIPADCRLTVGGEQRCWERGKVIAFDDSFLHDARNGSQEERIVLIFSVWQPDLSAAERAAIQRSFVQRQTWLEGRRSSLETFS